MPDACCFVDDEGSKIELRAVETDINGGADEPLSGRSLQLWSGGKCEVDEVDELEWRLWDNKICLFDGADLPMGVKVADQARVKSAISLLCKWAGQAFDVRT